MVHQVSKAEVKEVRLNLGRPARTAQNRWMRTRTGSGWPTVWSQTSSQNRLLETEASSRLSWFGRWHLAERVHMLNNMVSIRSRNSAVFWQAIDQLTSELSVGEQVRLWRSLRVWLAIEGFIHASDRVDTVEVKGAKLDLVDLSSRFVRQDSDLWAYPDWQYSSERLTVAVLVDRFQQAGFLLDEKGHRNPEQQRPVVEVTDDFQPVVSDDQPTPGKFGLPTEGFWNPQRLQQQPESAVYRVQINTPVLITRPTIQDGNWHARFSSVSPNKLFSDSDRGSWQSVDVHSVDGITQGVLLPSGEWWLEFYYQPWWLSWSIATFAVGWFGFLVCFMFWRTDPEASVPDAPVPAASVSC